MIRSSNKLLFYIFCLGLIFSYSFFLQQKTQVYGYYCNPLVCNGSAGGLYATAYISTEYYIMGAFQCYRSPGSVDYTCRCSDCSPTGWCTGGYTYYSSPFCFESSKAGSVGCCQAGSTPPPTCVKVCSTPSCDVTDAMCATANGNNNNYDAYTTTKGADYCPGTSASCSVASNCTGQNCTATEYCYRAANCRTNCTLPSCTASETTTATPNQVPEACKPRTVSCSNLTDCDLNNNCADSTGQCYPIGACQNCTPSTPSGYHIPAVGETTNSLPECTTTNTCNKTNLCRQDVCGTVTNTFYRNERNTTNPASPTAPRMTIDGINFNLSTDTSAVTRIKKPLPTSAENTVSFSITGITVNATTTYGPWYDYNVENKGVNFVWFDSTPYNCTGSANEDFCYWNDTSTTKEFHGTFVGHKTPTQILLEGAQGTVAYRSKTTDRCTSGDRYSDWTFPSYKVNNLPRVTDVLISGNDDYRGCKATASYTGLNANNPLKVTIKGTDADGLPDINGAIIWLVKDSSTFSADINKLTYFNAATPRTDANKIGIIVRRDNTNTYVANIVSGALSNWSSSPQTQVIASSGQVLVSSIATTHYQELLKYVFEITLTFPNPPVGSPLLSGKYDVYAALTDTLTYSNYLDQQNVVDTTLDWNFDFVKPSVGTITQTINDQRNVSLTWQNSDEGSSPKSNVLNIYKSGISNAVTPAFSPDSKPSSVPNPPTIIGDITPLLSGWYYSTPTANAVINIGGNTSGTMNFYPTVYDQACNRNDHSSAPSLDLNRWISTKGGILFSQSTMNYVPKTVDGFDYNLGTELITLYTGTRPFVLVLEDIKRPITAISVNDTNFTGRGNLFAVLRDRANFYEKKNNYTKITALSECDTGNICVWNNLGTLTIGNNLTTTFYKGKVLIISTGDITILPNIKAFDSTMDGLIILSAVNITIGGTNKNQTPVYTDEIDALLLANREISIPRGTDADTNPGIQQDAVKITGSMLALGSGDPSRAFNLERNLGLLNPIHPVLIINYHPKYTKISELFFGTDNKIYKQEVGYKL